MFGISRLRQVFVFIRPVVKKRDFKLARFENVRLE